jgi:hypothetical protein
LISPFPGLSTLAGPVFLSDPLSKTFVDAGLELVTKRVRFVAQRFDADATLIRQILPLFDPDLPFFFVVLNDQMVMIARQVS